MPKLSRKPAKFYVKSENYLEKDPKIFHVYAELAKCNVYSAERLVTALAEAESVHENIPELMEICARVLKTADMHYGPY